MGDEGGEMEVDDTEWDGMDANEHQMPHPDDDEDTNTVSCFNFEVW